jgi:hypothetical protein
MTRVREPMASGGIALTEGNDNEEIEMILQNTLWQVEESKKERLNTSSAMNFISLSKEAMEYENFNLARSLLNKACDLLFNDYVALLINKIGDEDVVRKMRLERVIKDARDNHLKTDAREAYRIVRQASVPEKPRTTSSERDDSKSDYSSSLDMLQKVWLKMKQEERKGKDLKNAQSLVKEAKKALSVKDFRRVKELCDEVMRSIQTPRERLREESEETIDEISATMKALFTEEPTSPKEKLFKKQIDSLLEQARKELDSGNHVGSINSSRKAREILKKLEQETIKSEIPSLMAEYRVSLDELISGGVDVSYEEYLLKSIEETFWKGDYIEAMKMSRKLGTTIRNAKTQHRMLGLSERLGDLTSRLKEMIGKDGYPEAKEYLDKAKILIDQKAFDMADEFISKASDVLT